MLARPAPPPPFEPQLGWPLVWLGATVFFFSSLAFIARYWLSLCAWEALEATGSPGFVAAAIAVCTALGVAFVVTGAAERALCSGTLVRCVAKPVPAPPRGVTLPMNYGVELDEDRAVRVAVTLGDEPARRGG